jgi:RNA polymerase sigma-70 factor (ECF subfamily)
VTREPLAAGLVDAYVADRIRRPPMNEAAFLDFYARTAGPLIGYLRRLTGNVTTAEDLLQEAYLRFLGAARVPVDPDHRRNYLFRIATNLARDHFRHERRYLSVDDDRRFDRASTPAHATDAQDVWSALKRVTARDRELLLLAYVEGLTHREISQITGLMRASVKPLLFRARKRFGGALRAAGLAPDTLPGGVA